MWRTRSYAARTSPSSWRAVPGSDPLVSVHVVANPNAAGGRGARAIPGVERALGEAGVSFRLLRTRAPGEAADLAEGIPGGVGERLLIVGGDGTIHEVVTGLLRRGPAGPFPPIAILPVGTGNDFHRMIQAPKGPAGVVRLLTEGRVRLFDVGHARWDAGDGPFVNLLGVGIDVEVLRRRPTFARLPGLLQYMGALGSALPTFRAPKLRVSLVSAGGERKSFEGPTLIAALTVGPSIGGGFLVSPRARPDDGLLDLFLVEKLGIGKVLRYLPGILRGSLEGKREVHQEQVTAVEIATADGSPLSFQLDGELMPGTTVTLELRVLPRILPILELPGEVA